MSLALAQGTPIPPRVEIAEVGVGLKKAARAHNVPYVHQDKDQWCWAACFQMIRAWLGRPGLSQQQMATAYFGQSACSNPDSPACNRGAFPDRAAGPSGLYCESIEQRLDAARLATELGAGPVEAYLEFEAGAPFSAHVVLITDLAADGTVEVLDPWPAFGRSYPRLAELHTNYNGGTWERSYVRFEAI